MSTSYGPYDPPPGQQQPGAPGGYDYAQGQYAPQGGYGASPQQGGYAPYPPQGGYAPGAPRGYLQGGPVGFADAITEAFRNMFNYQGRASRSAYWWFALFAVIVYFVLMIIGLIIKDLGLILDVLAWLALAITSIPLLVRRLHDTNKSGFWAFIGFVPFVGPLVLLIFALLGGTPGPNRFG